MSLYYNNINLSRVKRKKQNKKRLFRWILLSTVIVVLGISGVVGYTYWKFTNSISEPNVNIPANDVEPVEVPKLEEQSIAVLLIGLDFRQETGSRNTDAIIVSILNPSTKKVSLLSIPRDTRVYLPDYGYLKINSVYAKGEHERIVQERNGIQPTINGSKLLMETLSDLLNIPISYYVKVDFKGFETIIDELGGLKLYVDRDMNYYSESDGTYINLKKGLQKLDGDGALDFVRFRKSNDGNDSNDFERNQRQQELIKALVDEMVSINGISKIFSILNITGEHIKINMSPDEIKALFWKYKGTRSSDIYTIKMESYWENPFVLIEANELNRIKIELKDALSQAENK